MPSSRWNRSPVAWQARGRRVVGKNRAQVKKDMTTPIETIPSLAEEVAAAIKELYARVENLVTEDDEPVDNLYSEKQQRLLTEPLYSSWAGPEPEVQGGQRRPFLVSANVGLFFSINEPPLVPDVFLSLDVTIPEDWHEKHRRTYFFWEFGKPPDVVIEVVSNQKGNELGSKLHSYARIGIPYYIVYDPARQLGEQVLHIFERNGSEYVARTNPYFKAVGLGVALWEGVFEGVRDTWLRWCDSTGEVIPTGAERAEREAERAQREAERAQREAERAARLAAKLRELGIDPDTL